MTSLNQHFFWLASRAVGVTAIILLAATMILGLALSGRALRDPGFPGYARVVHESLALTAIVAILAHGLLLLGDSYLHPSVPSIFVPFLLGYRSLWTGLGIIAAYLVAIFTFSFYVRRRITTRVWRRLHRFTPLGYALSVAHVVGAGTDGQSPWMLALLALITIPVLALLIRRHLPRRTGKISIASG
jgi:sulfoxide reductase heme-binding subunit YedZ